MSTPEDIAAVYARDLTPRLQIRPSTALGLYYERPYREYRVIRPAWALRMDLLPPRGSTQLALFPEDSDLI